MNWINIALGVGVVLFYGRLAVLFISPKSKEPTKAQRALEKEWEDSGAAGL